MSSVAQLIKRASRILNDQEEGYSYTGWTADELLDYYNEAVCQIYNFRPDLFAESSTLTLAPGSKQTLPDGIGNLLSIDSNLGEDGDLDEDTPLTMSSGDMVKALRGKPTCVEATTCEPFKIRGYRKSKVPNVFFVEPPVPEGETVEVDVTVAVGPMQVCGGDITNETQLDCRLDPAIVDWILFRAMGRDTESQFLYQAARRHQAAFYDAINGGYLAQSRMQSGYMLGREGDGVETTGWRNELRQIGR